MTKQVQGLQTKEQEIGGSIAPLIDHIINEPTFSVSALRVFFERYIGPLTKFINGVFWTYDYKKQQVIYVSPSFETIWEYPSQELYENPTSWLSLIVEQDRAEVERAFVEKAPQGGFDIQYRLQSPSGNIRYIRDRGFPIKHPSGEVYQIIGFAEDITRNRQMEEMLTSIRSLIDDLVVDRPSRTKEVMSLRQTNNHAKNFSPLFELTQQQKRVLALVAAGKTNKEIAVIMNLSEKTIRNHLALVFEKLQVTRRSQAVAIFVKFTCQSSLRLIASQ